MTQPRSRPLPRALRRALAALGVAALLGGCVAYPGYPDYSYYGSPGYAYAGAPAYAYSSPGYVTFGGSWSGRDHDRHDGGWRDGGRRDGGRRDRDWHR